ncbi:MAG TPA: PfkB family carbohydrate kinase [Candidatus Thermoplasmatota archaeon]|nr:PfkB family carbohydrate kinase [Candidatus Thermoplasmatota archaeon]
MHPQAQRVLVVGSIGIDTVETPFGKATDVLGGSATYASAAASYFAPVDMVAAVGEDFDLRQFSFLQARGVNLEGLEVVKGGKTFRWGGKYHFDLNTRDTLFTDLNVLGTFDPKLPAATRGSPYVLLGNMHPLVQAKVLDQMAARPKFVVGDTMNLWINIARKELEAILGRLDCLIINDSEARELSGSHNLIKAAANIRRLGPKTLVIKKGEHGALLFHGNDVFSAPAFPLEDVFDPTGAGDAFAGGFLGHLAAKDRVDTAALRQAVVWGSALASFCVERFSVEGLREVPPKALSARYAAFKDLAHFEAEA